MNKLFLIPGLGADERLFQHLKLDDYQVLPIKWIAPHPKDSLSSYAKKLVEHYHIDKGSTVLGVSLGAC